MTPLPRAVACALVAVAASGMASVACSSAKREASALVAAVDAFRRAENVDKPARARAVEDAVCTDSEVCDVRASCVASTAPTAKGLARKAEVEAALADLSSGKLTKDEAQSRDLAGKLDEASRLLDEGHRALPVCDQKIAGLRLKYGL
jgi:hypothetical protein